MRRSLVAALLSVLALGLVLTACGDDDSSGSDHPMGSMPGGGQGGGMMDGHHESTPVAEGARRIELDLLVEEP